MNLHLTYHASDPIKETPAEPIEAPDPYDDVPLVDLEHKDNPFVLLGVLLGCLGSLVGMIWKGIGR